MVEGVATTTIHSSRSVALTWNVICPSAPRCSGEYRALPVALRATRPHLQSELGGEIVSGCRANDPKSVEAGAVWTTPLKVTVTVLFCRGLSGISRTRL